VKVIPQGRTNSAFVNDRAFRANTELVIQTKSVQTIDILVSNFDDGAHPYHLHGYKFFVLAQGHGQPPLTSVGAVIDRESLSPLYETLDLSNPLRRDTASVESYGWILLRIVADNPGQWAFHCHVSWHSEAGLLMQFLTNTDELAKMQIPQANRDLCAAEEIWKGMGPNDEDYIHFAR
jgi:FtsP/CotA-like multicopper oxidase with cupredoxin domain